MGLAALFLLLSLRSHFENANPNRFLLEKQRSIAIYVAVLCFSCLGLVRNFGVVVYAPLLAGLLSGAILVSGVNRAAQMLLSLFTGLLVGVAIETLLRKNRKP